MPEINDFEQLIELAEESWGVPHETTEEEINDMFEQAIIEEEVDDELPSERKGNQMELNLKVSQKKYINSTQIKNTLKEGETIIILDPGTQSQFGHVEFKVQLPNGEEKVFRFNDSSLASMVSKWGNNTEKWVGNKVVYKGETKLGKFKGVLFNPGE